MHGPLELAEDVYVRYDRWYDKWSVEWLDMLTGLPPGQVEEEVDEEEEEEEEEEDEEVELQQDAVPEGGYCMGLLVRCVGSLYTT